MKKPTTWRPNSRLRVSDKPLKKTAVRKRNGPRLAKRRREEYGKHAGWVVAFPCFICDRGLREQETPTVAAHASKTRGAGGKAKHIVDLCVKHEKLWHAMGPDTYDRFFKVDCKARAAYLWSVSPHNPDNALTPEGAVL